MNMIAENSLAYQIWKVSNVTDERREYLLKKTGTNIYTKPI